MFLKCSHCKFMNNIEINSTHKRKNDKGETKYKIWVVCDCCNNKQLVKTLWLNEADAKLFEEYRND